MAMQNAWLLYQSNKDQSGPALDLLTFRREVVNIYLQKYANRYCTLGRPHGRILPAKRRVSSEIRFDHIGHYRCPIRDKRQEHQKKCDVGVHDHCFDEWHGHKLLSKKL